MLKTSENNYGGITIDTTILPETVDDFKSEIIQIIEKFKSKELLWIKIPIESAKLIPILTNLTFEFHHCDEKNVMLVKKLSPHAIVPTTKNFIVGVGAIVFNDGQLLVIKDNFLPGYKLPGGHIDKKESIKNAVKREVYEETGIHIEFESIVNIGHFLHGQFGESNIYIVCTAKALSTTISIRDSSEIAEATWIDPHVFLQSEEANIYNKSVVAAAINNKELKLTEQHITLRAPDSEVFF